jgi:DUF971 family protein
MSEIRPTEIRVSKDKKTLTVSFNSGKQYVLEAELLRVRSPSAEVQGHSPDQRVLVFGKKDVGIMKIHPIGNYAIRIEFDDMHNTGIFSWEFLSELGTNKADEWTAYEEELVQAGRKRERVVN